MKNLKIFLMSVSFFLAYTILGMDGVEYLKRYRFLSDVSISSTSLDLTFNLPHKEVHMYMGDRDLQHGDKVSLTPEHTTYICDGYHFEMAFKPVIFKNQYKGFRIVPWIIGAFADRDKPIVTYIVLNDTPMKLSEEDVEMVMDNGKWVKIEDSKSLIIDKLGWESEQIVKDVSTSKQVPPNILRLLDDPYYSHVLRELNKNGLINIPPENFNGETMSDVPQIKSETQLENENVQTNDANAWVAEAKTSSENTPPCRPACRAWLWWFALLPVAAGVWFVVRFLKK